MRNSGWDPTRASLVIALLVAATQMTVPMILTLQTKSSTSTTQTNAHGRLRLLTKDVQATTTDLWHCEELVPREINNRSYYYDVVLKGELDAVLNHYQSLDSKRARRDYDRERCELLKQISTHASLCEVWAQQQSTDRKSQLSESRQQRYMAIVDSLSSLGMG